MDVLVTYNRHNWLSVLRQVPSKLQWVKKRYVAAYLFFA